MRKGQIILLLCAIVFLGACRPKGILTSRQMRSVLYDLHRAEAIIQVSNLAFGHDEEVAKYYQVVLDKHGISQAEFDSSLVWYTNHPQLFNKIYPKILMRCMDETNSWVTYEQELVSAETATPVRELTPLEDVFRTTQKGWDSQLLTGKSDSVVIADTTALPLPIGCHDGVEYSVKQEQQETPQEPEKEEVRSYQDSIKEARLNRLRRRFGMQTSEAE